MSRQAMAFVAQYSQTKGSKRAVMMALANACSKKKQPYVKRISAAELAPLVGLKTRQVQNIVKDLDESGEISIYMKGEGQTPHTYEIRCVCAQSDCVTNMRNGVPPSEDCYAIPINGSRTRHTAKRLCSDISRPELENVDPPF